MALTTVGLEGNPLALSLSTIMGSKNAHASAWRGNQSVGCGGWARQNFLIRLREPPYSPTD